MEYAFAWSPIMASVTAPVLSQKKDEYQSNGRLVLQIMANGTVYDFPSGFSSGEILEIDVSSAARAEFIRTWGNVGAHSGGCPTVRLSIAGITATCLQNGAITALHNHEAHLNVDTVLRGGMPAEVQARYADANSMIADYSEALTLKPMDDEIEVVSDSAFAPIRVGLGGTTSVGAHYVDTQNPFRREMRFVNSFGVVESISIIVRESGEMQYQTQTLAQQQGSGWGRRATQIVKANKRNKRWKMSSGYVSRAWAEWFAGEFLPQPHRLNAYWLYDDGNWIPVTVQGDDTVSIYDLSKGELASVSFVVTA